MLRHRLEFDPGSRYYDEQDRTRRATVGAIGKRRGGLRAARGRFEPRQGLGTLERIDGVGGQTDALVDVTEKQMVRRLATVRLDGRLQHPTGVGIEVLVEKYGRSHQRHGARRVAFARRALERAQGVTDSP